MVAFYLHLVLLGLTSCYVALATPGGITLLHPLALQHPPVARIKQAFSWSFAPLTFNSTSPLDYTALDIPPWLSFVPANRSFQGCPTENDVGSYQISVTATTTDSQRHLSDILELVVSSRPGNLSITEPVSEQLVGNDTAITSAFSYSPTSIYYPGVRVPPNWSFSLGFQPYTYTAPSRVFYSAVLADGSPLPAWLDFNNQTVTFDGVTPTPKTPVPEVFTIVLSGSDTFGFADISQSFNICIAAHDFVQIAPIAVNLTVGEDVSTSPTILDSFTLDGKSLKKGDIGNITLDTSSQAWLAFIQANTSILGTPPISITAGQREELPLIVTDIYGDQVNTTVTLAFQPSHFTQPLFDPIIASPGQSLDVSLAEFLIGNSGSINLTTSFNPSKSLSWLAYVPSNTSLVGTVPPDVDYDSVLVNLAAQDLDTHAWSHAVLQLILAPNGTTNANNHHPHHGLTTGTKIALASVGAIVGSLIVLCILFLSCRRCLARKMKLANKAVDLEAPVDKDGDEPWGFEYKAETPAMSYPEKMGEPPSVQLLAGRAEHEISANVMSSLPHLSSGLSGKGDTATKSRLLKNPFARKNKRVIPKISNPMVQPSLSNAAFQAQLAAAVDAAGIVARGGTTFNDGATDITTSEFTDSQLPDTSGATSMTDESQFNGHSSRASWESEAPFVWTNADTGRNMEVASTGGGSEEYPSTSATPSEETHETTSSALDSSEPVQRSDFRHPPLPLDQVENDTGVKSIRHDVVTPVAESEEGISIDNIHFPTDSDIAHTEASSEHEAVIRTASRVSARRTLDSPVSSASPASSHTERAATPIITTHSRLVSFGQQRNVQVNGGQRSVSQTAVVVGIDSPGRGSVRSDESTPIARPRVPPDSPLPALPSSLSSGSNKQSRSQSRSPTPPSSLPSLPALPTAPSGLSSARSSVMPLPQRILLGVAEPFHFYPPLALPTCSTASSLPSSGTSSDKAPSSLTSSGAGDYVAYIEKDGKVDEVRGQGWLRFEEMELWGCPGEEDRGVWDVRVVERRRGRSERVVGRFKLEVVGR
ncbi:hypothetical protein BCR39DRAFT_533916 [Naematelia encephala]|uniref:Dystroglycan-type cadherin-like domain-containing protein n=1 Tax=Naematelia encephala TaxID=71784 RepID=A0A1Y2B231_9TREE|nr:hypothetical protein BCR39DRAFT_533916 [Naematelia encephala]